MKKFFLVLSVASVVALSSSGCVDSSEYHEMNDDRWLIEQVDNGTLTQHEADQIKTENSKNK